MWNRLNSSLRIFFRIIINNNHKNNNNKRRTKMTSTRNYESAVSDLNSLQSNASTIQDLRTSGKNMNQLSIPEMEVYLKRIGYQHEDLNALNIIHITGTKGKGSTSAFCDSILKRIKVIEEDNNSNDIHLQQDLSQEITRNLKTGLFTSPHLMEARERIRINGVPIGKEQFAKYFYDVWDELESNQSIIPDEESNTIIVPLRVRPAYFRFLTLLAFHVFIQENVDVVILEVGIGGEYDSTNVIQSPIVTCITSLGFDHVQLLGDTIDSIAWHKSGIFKKNSIAFSVEQPDKAMQVVRDRAKERQVASFDIVSTSEMLDTFGPLELGLKGEYQKTNAAIALTAVKAWVNNVNGRKIGKVSYLKISDVNLDSIIKEGLEKASWPGRSQMYKDPAHENVTFYLDGAHTEESMAVCAEWFKTELKRDNEKRNNILIFNLTRGRLPERLLKSMISLDKEIEPFFKVIFCTNQTYKRGNTDANKAKDLIDHNETISPHLEEQHELKNQWMKQTQQTKQVIVVESIQEALEEATMNIRENIIPSRILVTGSLHLIGGVLTVLNAPVT